MPARAAPQYWGQFLSRNVLRLNHKRPSIQQRATPRSLFPGRSFRSPISYLPEYEWIDGAEDLNGYAKGGYHPIRIGDILHSRYQVIDKLGFGGWSTVWLVNDMLEKRLLAAKVGVAESLPSEIGILRTYKSGPPQLLI